MITKEMRARIRELEAKRDLTQSEFDELADLKYEAMSMGIEEKE